MSEGVRKLEELYKIEEYYTRRRDVNSDISKQYDAT